MNRMNSVISKEQEEKVCNVIRYYDMSSYVYMRRRSMEGSIRWLTIAQRPFVEIPSLKVLWKGAIEGDVNVND